MLLPWFANFWSCHDLMSHRCLCVSSLSRYLSYCLLIGPNLNFTLSCCFLIGLNLNFTFTYSWCIRVDAYFSRTPSLCSDAIWGHHPNNILQNLMKAGAGRGFISILPSCSSVLTGTISMVGLAPSDAGCVYSRKW